METFLWIGGMIFIVLALQYWQVILTAFSLALRRFQEPSCQVVQTKDIPKSFLVTSREKRQKLKSWGFIYRCAIQSSSSLEGAPPVLSLIFWNPETSTFAEIAELPYVDNVRAVNVTFYTRLKSGQSMYEFDCWLHNLISSSPEHQYFDSYTGSIDKQWFNHKSRLNLNPADENSETPEFTEKPSAEDVLCYYRESIRSWFLSSKENRDFIPLSGEWNLINPKRLWRAATKIVSGEAQVLKIENKCISLNKHEQKAVLERFLSFKSQTGLWGRGLMLIFSAVGFSLLFGAAFSWTFLPLLMLVLIVHELGHFLAMAVFGYKDKGIYFLPLGAVAVGTKEKEVAWQQFIIYIMGPLPGLLISTVLFFNESLYGIEWIQEYVMVSFIINTLNLLPIYPLDGGQIVDRLLLRSFPRSKFIFICVSGMLFALGAWFLSDWVLAVLAIITALGLRQSWKQLMLLKSLNEKVSKSENVKSLKDIIVDQLTSASCDGSSMPQKVTWAKFFMSHFQQQKISKTLSSLLLSLYLMVLIVPVVAGGLYIMSQLEDDEYSQPKYWKQEISEAESLDKKWYLIVQALDFVDATEHDGFHSGLIDELDLLINSFPDNGLKSLQLKLIKFEYGVMKVTDPAVDYFVAELEQLELGSNFDIAEIYRKLSELNGLDVERKLKFLIVAREKYLLAEDEEDYFSILQFINKRIGDVYLEELNDDERAIDAYEEGMAYESSHSTYNYYYQNMNLRPLIALLYETGNYRRAIGVLTNHVEIVQAVINDYSAESELDMDRAAHAQEDLVRLYQSLGWFYYLDKKVNSSIENFQKEYELQDKINVGERYRIRTKMEAILDNILANENVDPEAQRFYIDLIRSQSKAEVDKFVKQCECKSTSSFNEMRVETYLRLLRELGSL